MSTIENYVDLAKDLILKRATLVDLERFKTIIELKNYIDSIDGSIVECGVWRGGSFCEAWKLWGGVI